MGLRRALARTRARPASTSPARRASTRATSTTSTTATRSPASAAHSRSRRRGARRRPAPASVRAEARRATRDRAVRAQPEEQMRRRLLEQKRRALTKTRETARNDGSKMPSGSLSDPERSVAGARRTARGNRAPTPRDRPRESTAGGHHRIHRTASSGDASRTPTRWRPGGAGPGPRASDDVLETREVAGTRE